MNDDSRLISQLEWFGLSEKEAAVYLSLVDRGRAKLSVVATDADVSQSYVYQLCEKLEREELVTVNDHQTPTTVQPLPPPETLRPRKDQMEEALLELERRYSRPTLDMDSLEVLRTRDTLFRHLSTLIESAESEVYLSMPLEGVLELAEDLRNAVDRGVLVLLAIGGDAAGISAADIEGVATAVRRRVRGMTIYLSVDLERGIVAPASVLGWEHGEEEGVSYHNLSIASAIQSAFLGTTWPASEEVFLRRPTSLPETYDTIRPAVYDLTLMLNADRTVHAELEAHPTRSQIILDDEGTVTESHRTLTGTVVETRQNFVKPTNTDFAVECGFRLDTGDETIQVGGTGAFLEDYTATEITLHDG